MADLKSLIELQIAVEESGDKNAAKKLAEDIALLGTNSVKAAELNKKAMQQIEAGETSAAKTTIAELNKLEASNKKAEEAITRVGNASLKASKPLQEVGESSKKSDKNIKDFTNNIGQLNEFAPESVKQLNGIASSFADVAEGAGPAGVAVAALIAVVTGAVTVAKELAQQTAEYAKEQSNIQKAVGASASFIAGFSEALKSNGGDAKDTTDVLLQLGGTLQDAVADPAGEAAKKFETLGIKAVDASGKARSIESVFRDIDKAAQSGALSQEKLVTLAGILGDDGAKKILPLLGSFEAIEEKAKAAGLVIGNDTAKQAEKLTKGLFDLEERLKGIAISIGGDFLGSFNEIITQAKITFDNLSKDTNFQDGIKALIDATKDFISTAGPDLVTAVQGILQVIGGLGKAVGFVAEGFKSLRSAIVGKTEAAEKDNKATEEQNQALGSVTQAAKQQEVAFDALKRKLTELAAVRQADAGLQKSLEELRVTALKEGLEKGSLAERATILSIQKEQQEAAQRDVDSTAKTVNEKIRLALAEAEKKGELGKKTAQEILANNTEVLAAEKANVDAVNALENLKIAGRQQLRELDFKKLSQNLQDQLKQVELVQAQETQLVEEKEQAKKESHEKAEREKLQISKLSIQAELAGIDQILASNKASAEEKKALEQRKKDLIFANEKLEIDSVAKIKAAKLKDLEEDISNAQASIAAIDTLREASFERRRNEISLLKDADLQKFRQEQLEIDLLDETTRKAQERVTLEGLQLEKIKAIGASDAEIALQEDKITAAIEASNIARDQAREKTKQIREAQKQQFDQAAKAAEAENAAVVDLADRSKSLAGALDSVAGKITEVRQGFDLTKISVQDLQKYIIDLRSDAETIRFDPGSIFPGKDVVVKYYEDTAAAAEEILRKRVTDQQLINFQEEQKRELEERRKAAQEAFQIAKEEKQEEENLSKEFAAKEKDLTNQINQNKLDAAITLGQLKQEQAKKLEAFDNEENRKELEKADQQHEALLQKEENFQSSLIAKKDAGAKEAASKVTAAAEKAADIDLALQDLIEKRKNEKDPNNQKSLDEQIKQKQLELANADKAEVDRAAREKRKQEEIAKAQESAKEKLKGAKSADEVTEIEKELGIQIDGINEKFANEQKYAEDLAKYQGKVSQERLDAITAAYKAEQAVVEQNVQNRIDAERRQTALVEDARKKAEDKEKSDAETRRQKLIDDQKKEYDDRKTAFENKQTQLENALKTERESYKTHLEELRTKTAQSLADIASSFTDGGPAAEKFFKDFAANAGLTGKAIDDILSKLKQFKDQTASDNQQQNNAAGSPSGNNGSGNSNFGSNFGGNGQPGQGGGGLGNNFGSNITTRDNTSSISPSSTPSNPPSSNNINPNQKGNNVPDLNLNPSASPSGSSPNTPNPPSRDSGKNPGQGGNPDDTPPSGSASDLNSLREFISKTYDHFIKIKKTKNANVIFKESFEAQDKVVDAIRSTCKALKINILDETDVIIAGKEKDRDFRIFLKYNVVSQIRMSSAFAVAAKVLKDQFFAQVDDLIINEIPKGIKDEPEKDDNPAKATPGSDGKSVSVDASGKKVDTSGIDTGAIVRTGSSNTPSGGKKGANNKVPTFDRSSEATGYIGEGASAAGYVDPGTGRVTPNTSSSSNPSGVTGSDGLAQPPPMSVTQTNQVKNEFSIQITGLLSDPETLKSIEDMVNKGIETYNQKIQEQLRSSLNGMQYTS